MRIAVTGGHTPTSPGANGLLNELYENRRVKDALIEVLRERGHEVFDVTPPDWMAYPQETNHQWQEANRIGVDLGVSIHLNAGGGTGTEVLYCSGYSKPADYAARISASLAGLLGIPNRGAKARNDLAWLNMTSANAVLAECCFVDHGADKAAWDRVSYRAIAEAVAYGIDGQTAPTVPVEPPKPTKWDGPGVEYAGANRAETARIIADAARPNAKHTITVKGSSFADCASIMWAAGALGARILYAETAPTIDGMEASGDNRYLTNIAFKYLVDNLGVEPDYKHCFVIGSDAYPDAVACAGWSYSHRVPILLYKQSEPTFWAQVEKYQKVTVLGNDIPKLQCETERIAGDTRYATCVQFAETYYPNWRVVNIVSGSGFADGMAMGQRSGDTPVLLAGGQATLDALAKHKGVIKELTWTGNLDAIDYNTRKAICMA